MKTEKFPINEPEAIEVIGDVNYALDNLENELEDLVKASRVKNEELEGFKKKRLTMETMLKDEEAKRLGKEQLLQQFRNLIHSREEKE